MEVFENLGVKIPNAVLVEGTTLSESDEEVVDFLERYCKINRTEVIKESQSKFYETTVVEFDSGTAIATLKPILPYTIVSEDGTTYYISDLSTVYSDYVGKSKK